MISKGIDLDALFKAWETADKKCFDVKDVYSPFWQDIVKQTQKCVIDEQMKFTVNKFMKKDSIKN